MPATIFANRDSSMLPRLSDNSPETVIRKLGASREDSRGHFEIEIFPVRSWTHDLHRNNEIVVTKPSLTPSLLPTVTTETMKD